MERAHKIVTSPFPCTRLEILNSTWTFIIIIKFERDLFYLYFIQWRTQGVNGDPDPSHFLEIWPSRFVKIHLKIMSRRAFPRICESLEGVNPNIFRGYAPRPPLLKSLVYLRLHCSYFIAPEMSFDIKVISCSDYAWKRDVPRQFGGGRGV